MAQPHATTVRTSTATAPDPTARSSSRRRCRTRSCRRWTSTSCPSTSGEKQRRQARSRKYAATDGVGSGPFALDKFEKGQFARFKANPNYWGGKPAVDEVVLRNFNNPDAMVAALKTRRDRRRRGRPGRRVRPAREGRRASQTVEGHQGGVDELAINGGDGLKKPHPALLDPRVRQAIAHAIDKKTLVDRVLARPRHAAETLSPSPDPTWTPEIPPTSVYDFDLDKAKQILDDAGYKDTDGDGIREMPGGGQPLNFRYAVRSEGDDRRQPIAEFITGWLKEIGIATTQKVYDDSQLTEVIGKGDYDMFVVGLDAVRRPRPDALVLHVRPGQRATRRTRRTTTTTRTGATSSTTRSTSSRTSSSTRPSAMRDRPPDADALLRSRRSTTCSTRTPTCRRTAPTASRAGSAQPAKTGPVLFSNTSPTYAH